MRAPKKAFPSGADSPCQGEMARRARGGRVGEYEREALILSRALAPLWFLSGRPERNPPRRAELPCRPQAAKSPCKKRNRSVIAPSSVTASPCHLPPEGKAFEAVPSSGPLTRGVGPRGDGFGGGPVCRPCGESGPFLEKNRNNPSPLFPLFNFQLLC